MNILVIAPHGDDEILGCGGVMARYSENNDIYICYVTQPTEEWNLEYKQNRNKEIDNVKTLLNIKEVFKLKLPTVQLDMIPQKELNELIGEVIRATNPDIMFIPSNKDVNMDHRIIHNACLVASRPTYNNIKKILSYETISETEWGNFGAFNSNVYIDISEYIDKKLEAMKCYDNELFDNPHPRSLDVIKSLARKRGSEINVMYAEAFELIREII